jgi:hypothetical protein
MLRLFHRCVDGSRPSLPHVTRREYTIILYYRLAASPDCVDCFQGIIEMILFGLLGCVLVRSTSCSYHHHNSNNNSNNNSGNVQTAQNHYYYYGNVSLGLSLTLAAPVGAAAAASPTTTAMPRGPLRAYRLYSKSRVGLKRCQPCFMF